MTRPWTPSAAFGHNLRAARGRAELSQEALASAAGLHPTEISRLERGVRDVRLSTIVRIARGLNTPAATLLDGIDSAARYRRPPFSRLHVAQRS
jgi:transcriptional regulator with XRE-family HTH domain